MSKQAILDDGPPLAYYDQIHLETESPESPEPPESPERLITPEQAVDSLMAGCRDIDPANNREQATGAEWDGIEAMANRIPAMDTVTKSDVLARAVSIIAGTQTSQPALAGSLTKRCAKIFGIPIGDLRAEIKSQQQVASKLAIDEADLFFFDGKSYYRRRGDRYEAMGREDTLMHLESLGAPRSRDGGLAPAEQILIEIQNERRADYAGPLCGRGIGLCTESSRKILVTSPPEIIQAGDPVSGPLMNFFANLFDGGNAHGEKQLSLFMGWMKQARLGLADPANHLPGQLLGLIGARDCGKSLAQELITRCLGGRGADASSWLQGLTTFNAQLWGAEHLTVSDANLEDDPRRKKQFRDGIKAIVANPTYPLARKHRDEISARPIWRISLSANDDPQSWAIIPSPLADPSLADKVIYLKCHAPPEAFPTDTPEKRIQFWGALIDDIPNFLGLVESFELPDELRKARFGVREFVHPDIVTLLDGANPDRELIDFIEDFLAEGRSGFSGRAKDLFDALEGHSEGRVRRCVRNSLVLTHALKRISTLPDWNGRITYYEDRFGENRQKGLRFILRKEQPGG